MLTPERDRELRRHNTVQALRIATTVPVSFWTAFTVTAWFTPASWGEEPRLASILLISMVLTVWLAPGFPVYRRG